MQNRMSDWGLLITVRVNAHFAIMEWYFVRTESSNAFVDYGLRSQSTIRLAKVKNKLCSMCDRNGDARCVLLYRFFSIIVFCIVNQRKKSKSKQIDYEQIYRAMAPFILIWTRFEVAGKCSFFDTSYWKWREAFYFINKLRDTLCV